MPPRTVDSLVNQLGVYVSKLPAFDPFVLSESTVRSLLCRMQIFRDVPSFHHPSSEPSVHLFLIFPLDHDESLYDRIPYPSHSFCAAY